MNSAKKVFTLAASLIALGIISGAFGAHGLKGHVEQVRFEAYQTAVLYHLINSLGLLIIAVAHKANIIGTTWLKPISILFILGIFLFSGSLYLLVIFDLPYLGAVTPFGGTLLIIAWSVTALGTVKSID